MASSSPFADGRPRDLPRGDTVYVEEPTADPELDTDEQLTRARLTHNPPTNTRPDEGYLMKGWRRVLRGEGENAKWWYTESEEDNEKTVYRPDPPGSETPFIPPDIYADTKTFPDKETTVQIVEFQNARKTPAVWLPPITNPERVFETLKSPPKEKGGWRWVHCTGLHGRTLKAVARATGWHERKFGGIFTWTRASMEWADNVLLVHFQNQGTRIFVWHGGGHYPVLITCNTLDPKDSSITRILDFVDRGCSRPEIVLRTDPSLLFYGIIRAVIQDLRYSVHHISHKMGEAFKKSTAQPSQANLSFFYHLQDRLFILSLDATSLKNAAINLVDAADRMHQEDEDLKANGKPPNPKRLISERARFMLKDQMGLITLLSQELPDVSRRAEAIVNLAFNTLAFNTNNLLQILAVITLASLPLTVATGILGINYFDADHVNGRTIAITISIVGGIVIIGLGWFIVWFIGQRSDRGDDGSQLAAQAKRKQTVDSFPQEKQNNRQRDQWARAQDLERDNQTIVQKKENHNPMMREFTDHQAPSPRSTSPVPAVSRQPTRRTTIGAVSLSLRRPNRHATAIIPRSPEAAAEEGNSLDNAAQRHRRHTSSPTSIEHIVPDTPPPSRGSGGGRIQHGPSASSSHAQGLGLPALVETPSRVSQ